MLGGRVRSLLRPDDRVEDPRSDSGSGDKREIAPAIAGCRYVSVRLRAVHR